MEVETLEDGLKFASMGADILQFDKMTLIKLYDAVPEIRTQYPHIILIATGGISRKNIVEYTTRTNSRAHLRWRKTNCGFT